MKVLVTGGTGLVGSQLIPSLAKRGNDVYRLTHSKPREANDVVWDPLRNQLPKARLEGTEVVVHLAGENIAGKRWNPRVKDQIRRSRVDGTRLLCETISQLETVPQTLICASATGFYGSRGSEFLNESSAMGAGFLAELCRDWEAACEPARAKGIRVVNLRIGFILSTKGGGLAKMIPPFRMGAGGILGSGNQFWSWISVQDVVEVINYCIANDRLSGPINVTAPCPVTNYEFTKTLGSVLGRATAIPMPALVARIMLGEMANELLLSSSRVMPNRLSESGYRFTHPSLEATLKDLLIAK